MMTICVLMIALSPNGVLLLSMNSKNVQLWLSIASSLVACIAFTFIAVLNRIFTNRGFTCF